MTQSPTFREFVRSTLLTALALSLVITLVPFVAALADDEIGADIDVDVCTAKSNETSTNAVLGGVPTRVTWECESKGGQGVASVHLQFPEGSALTSESTVRITVLEGIDRLETGATATIDTESAAVDVALPEPLTEGQRLRVETYKASLPEVTGEVTLSGTYTVEGFEGTALDLPTSPAIEISSPTVEEKISNFLDEQPAVAAWNSVTVLSTFLKPQLIVSSIPTVAWGWLRSLLLVICGFPLAIPIGLLFAFMRISKVGILKAIGAVYTGIVRGTPLFLQIYIAFFGLPMVGIKIPETVLAVMVLAFNSGAYLTEIFRAGIQSIPKGQFEASRSLGMTQRQTMFHVVIPQMVRRVIPTATSEFILLYKDTSLLAAVGVSELMYFSQGLVANTGNMTPYVVAACFYLIVTLPLTRVVTIFENRLALADGNAPAKKESKRAQRKREREAAKAEREAAARLAAEEKGADDER